MFYLAGCTTGGPRPVAARPVAHPERPTVVVAAAPARRPLVVARPVATEVILPEPNDVYISTAANSDVVFIGGNTYIWVTASDGRRHCHFYGHGDRRQEVFRRRENLRSVMTRRAGHPSHNDARQGDGHKREDIRRSQPTHTQDTAARHHSPQHYLIGGEQSRRPDQHRQPGRNPRQPMREASDEHNGVRNRAEPGVRPVRVQAPPKS